jgi:two-component system sensor histidine kinase DegS
MLYIRLRLEMLEHALPDGSELRSTAGEIRQMTEHTISEVRRVIAALSPAVLEQMGLSAAVRQLVNRFRQAFPARVELSISPKIGRLPRQTEVIAYRLAQECLNNVAKHSQASHINIRLNSADGLFELNVEDNGVGFNVGAALEKRESFGLAGMRERVALLGGRLEIESRPHRGARIFAELPIRDEIGGKGR